MRTEGVIDGRPQGFNWGVTAFMVGIHTCAVVALFWSSWQNLAVAGILWWVSGSLGIGMGYHRLLTHRGYRAPKLVEYFLTVCGTLALEGGPIAWVATHRIHHAFTEKEGDPHSPRDGTWWSHMGWILNGKSLHWNTSATGRYAVDLAKDPFYVWLTHWHFVPQVVVVLALFALGGWQFVFWGVFLRIVVSWHFTWLVNSAAHIWGSRRFETRDNSRNNWWVALIAFGEGWHNNHHAHPASARHGLAWYEFDPNWYGIRVLQFLGLAKAIRVAELPKKRATARHEERLADAA